MSMLMSIIIIIIIFEIKIQLSAQGAVCGFKADTKRPVLRLIIQYIL